MLWNVIDDVIKVEFENLVGKSWERGAVVGDIKVFHLKLH
jgi:hypothetical protein